jgi:quinone-modifying oxidoreductase, subunit QmoC
MSIRADPKLLSYLKRCGNIKIESCINCGNCSAVCSMTTEDESFPRKLIRYAQIGMTDELLGSKELWLCYNCGQCSDTCPRQAEPARFMATARCYAITHYDILGLSRRMCCSPVFATIFSILLAVILGVFMYGQTRPMPRDSLKLFEFLPYEFIHNFGLGVILFLAVVGLIGIVRMITSIARANHLSLKNFINGSKTNWWSAMWDALVIQALMQKRYREDCEAKENVHGWYLSKWFVHAAAMWGFMGLLAATILDYILDIVGLKPTGTQVPIWYPVRLLGTVAGLLFVYGVTILMIRRWKQTDKAHSLSRTPDWLFLIILWLSGMSGFLLEIGIYFPNNPVWVYWIFLFHVSVSMELILLLPYSKFAHAIYRTVALYINALKPIPEVKLAGMEATD